MTSKVIEGHKSLSNFSVNPTFSLMDGPLMIPSQIVCFSLFFLTLHHVLYSPLFLLLSLYIPLYLPFFCSMQTFLKFTWGHFYVAWLLMIFRSFDQITTLTYFNLNLRSYGQLFVLVLKILKIKSLDSRL